MFKSSHLEEVTQLLTSYIELEGDYKVTPFNKLYRLFKKEYKLDRLEFEKSTVELDQWECEELFEEAFFLIVRKTEEGIYPIQAFIKILNATIRNNIYKRQVRDISRRRKRNEAAFGGSILSLDKTYEGKKGDGSVLNLEVADNTNLPEVLVMAKLDNQTKTFEQKQALVSVLLNQATDKERMFAVDLAGNDFNYRQVARKHKTHHETVRRAIKSIAKHYDETKFGGIDSWLEPSK